MSQSVEVVYPIVSISENGVHCEEFGDRFEFSVQSNTGWTMIEVAEVYISKPQLVHKSNRLLSTFGPARIAFYQGATHDPKIVEKIALALVDAAAKARELNCIYKVSE